MDKLTHEEHAARAMLMGRVYDWRDGTYCFADSDGLPIGTALDGRHPMLDCETLEVIDDDKQEERFQKLNKEWRYWGSKPQPRPWAKD